MLRSQETLCYSSGVALTSSTTVTQAFAQLNDNLAWDLDRSKAALYLEAARWLLANRANSAKQGVSLNWESLENEIERARAFYVGTATPSARRRAHFVRGRPRRL